jgi:hypothetical protein
MKLDSVRELKTELLTRAVHPLSASVSRRSVLSAPSRVALLDSNAPTIAIGVLVRKANDYCLAVRVQDRRLEDSREIELIQRSARGEVDVRFVGRIAKQAAPWHQRRNRPLLPGSSIGHFKVTAGTLGCFVRKPGDERPLILSNNHVLANENRAKAGDAVIQPGIFDGGSQPDDAVGALVAFTRLKRQGINYVDCATATVADGIALEPSKLKGLSRIKGVREDIIGDGLALAKVGRTTGLTNGSVSAFEMDNLIVEFDIGWLRFDNVIEIEGTGNSPFSQGGDSGSTILDQDRMVAAILFAGGDTGGGNGKGLTYGIPIQSVLRALNVELMS